MWKQRENSLTPQFSSLGQKIRHDGSKSQPPYAVLDLLLPAPSQGRETSGFPGRDVCWEVPLQLTTENAGKIQKTQKITGAPYINMLVPTRCAPASFTSGVITP